jgi:hypothetical protein
MTVIRSARDGRDAQSLYALMTHNFDCGADACFQWNAKKFRCFHCGRDLEAEDDCPTWGQNFVVPHPSKNGDAGEFRDGVLVAAMA